MGMTKATQAEATRKKLIEIAFRAFSTRGYAGTATEDIVKTAGVTRGALYHHFKNKADLFFGVFCHAQQLLGERIETAASTGNDPWEELVNGCRAFLTASSDPLLQQILVIDGPAVLKWETIRRTDAEIEGGGFHLLKECLADLYDKGLLKTGSVDAAAHLLSGAMDEAAVWIASSDVPETALEEAMETLGMLLQGIKTPS